MGNKNILEESGKTISDADRAKINRITGSMKESKKTLSDADIDRLRRSAAARGLSYSGGKKISDKDLKHLAKNYKDGGAVCSGSGSAMQGTKFRGVR